MLFKSSKKRTTKLIFIALAFVICGVVVYYTLPLISSSNSIEYNTEQKLLEEKKKIEDKKEVIEETPSESHSQNLIDQYASIPISHTATPASVKALYMSGWVAGSENFRNSLVKIVDETELNAVVIDIKDSTGRLSFSIDDEEIIKIGSAENRIKNVRALTNLLHSKNIYIIGRISVFQDPYLTKVKPEWAVKKVSDGGIWKDRKGLSFLDPTNKNVHDYVLSIALHSYALGFDEINLDYIRYPSDGNIKDINYNLASGATRSDNIEKFFKYFSTELKKETNIPLSGDLFGLTTEGKDDMGIGQVWEKALPYFDYLCPMIYPSHYPSGYGGYSNPSLYPYEVIDKALKSAVAKTTAVGEDTDKIRPWLQDFDMGATYTKEMVKKQIQATYDNGLDSWMLWDPSNKYTPSALLLETSN
jgi:hypothetical protein